MLRERRPSAQTASDESAQAAVARVSALALEILHLADRRESTAAARHFPADAFVHMHLVRIDSHRVDACRSQVLAGQTVSVEIAVFPCGSAAHDRGI